MFLIDDDQFEITDGGKQGRAGADDHSDIAPPYAPPLIVADTLRYTAVQYRRFHAAKPAADPGDQLRRQCYFGDKENHPSLHSDGLFDGTQVHFRLAASRNAMQEAG